MLRTGSDDPSPDEEIPIVTPGDNITGSNGLGNNEYGKASLGYLAMKDLLGDDLFKKCLACLYGQVAWEASNSLGFLLYVQQCIWEKPKLVLEQLVHFYKLY